MNVQQDSGRPRPATKPSILSARSSSTLSIDSSHALRGATVAFSPHNATAPVSIASATAGARFAATAASGYVQRGRTDIITKDVLNSLQSRSPSRGRLPHSSNPQLAGARSAVSSSRSTAVRTTDTQQSPSAIAARLASGSPSPTRSAKGLSPLRRSPVRAGMDSTSYVTKPTSPSDNEHAAQPASVCLRMLSFEKWPTLKPQSESPPKDPTKLEANITTAGSISSTVTSTVPLPKVLIGPPTPSALTQALHEPAYGGMKSYSQTSIVSKHPENGAVVEDKQSKSPPPLPAPRRGGPAKSTSPVRFPVTPPVHNTKTGMTVSSLADAMVASTLASRRTPSPSKQRPIGLRHSASTSDLRDTTSQFSSSRSDMPTRTLRPMKHTLRKHSSNSGEEDTELTKRGRRHLVRKHPNKHHEGDRKRWRDRITEPERRRYEGVFAANRGILLGSGRVEPTANSILDPTADSNSVVNLVVRDIWERSRLPKFILMEIYDLVGPEEPLYLNREQFVVGLWLVDQSLKGRKLPSKVSDSVWNSVRHSHGIKIRSKPS